MATTETGINYAAAYDAVPFPVAVLEGGVEVYRNASAGELPTAGGESLLVLAEGCDALLCGGKWYTRRTAALRGDAALVAWQDVDDTVRFFHIRRAMTASTEELQSILDGIEAKEG